MKKIIFLLLVQIGLLLNTSAQVLNVNNNEQEYNQWCWAGSSKTILDYYGYVTPQCAIAEYTRTVATWNNFGTVNCCIDGSQGCNYWNYMYGSAGSIQDILVHFGNIQNIGLTYPITINDITTELQNNRLFVIRWGWSTGGGHFIVGHGINGNNIYFMNPWYGEGLHVGTYNFMLSGVDNTSTATHTWTHTTEITSNMLDVNEVNNQQGNPVIVYPNPVVDEATFNTEKSCKNATLTIYNSIGQIVKQDQNIVGQKFSFHRDNLAAGLYFYRLTEENNLLGKGRFLVQ